MRKSKYAARVKIITPYRRRGAAYYCASIGDKSSYSGDISIDAQHIEASLYLRKIEAEHGQGEEAGSEERGAGARRRPQSKSGSRPRPLVRQQPILRCEGPGASALRDGATSPGRRRCDQRGRRDIRRDAPDLLQGAERPADRRACRPVAEPARPQRRPQGLRRGRCVRRRSQSCKTRTDDVALPRCDLGAVRRQGAPTQPGAGAGAQKKRLKPA